MKKAQKIVEDIIAAGLEAKAFPGGQYALVNLDEVIINNFGVKDYILNEKTDGNEIYDIASLSKVISTSTLVHYFISKKMFNYDTYISEVLDYFPHKNIQVKDLLAHTSGLPAYLIEGNDLATKEEVIESIKRTKLIYEKNTKIIYSCVGFIVLGLLMEKLTNKPLDELAKKYVFSPLNMLNTTYNPTDKTRFVSTEFRDDKVFKGYCHGIVHDGLAYALGGVSGNAGVFSNVEDIAKYIQRLLKQDFLYPQENIDKMFESYIEIDDDNRSLGWAKPLGDKKDIITHTGFTGCNIAIDRKQKLGFVLLTNAIFPKRENNKIFGYRNKIFKELFTE